MRRTANLFPRVVSFDNLCRAAKRAARGKRRSAGAARFLADLEPRALALQRELESGTWQPGALTRFEIRDPKLRTISAAPFSDRVVHHALMAPLEPVFERRMVRQSFACRKGKGTHAALAHAQKLVQRARFFLKLDVLHCYESLEHDVVLATVARVVKDRRVLALSERIVRACGKAPGVGLPIGNLTSQWLANLVLDRLDHFVLEELRPRGYVRYMDDFVLVADEKEELRAALAAIAGWLEDTLHLRLKERATILAPTKEGLPFLGWRIYAGMLRLRPENRRRMIRRMRARVWEHESGRIDQERLVASLRASFEHLRAGSTLFLRRRVAAEIDAAGASRGPP